MSDPKRIVYASRRTQSEGDRDLLDILASARRNNGMDGVTGLLWADRDSFLQLLEGPPESVDLTFERISKDPRHSEVVVLDQRITSERAFADWAMASLPDEAPDDARARLRLILARVPSDVARHFADRC